MTLNMHEPYNICPQEYYDDQFIKSRLKKLNLENNPLKNKDNHTLGSLFFYEDALRDFLMNIKTRRLQQHHLYNSRRPLFINVIS